MPDPNVTAVKSHERNLEAYKATLATGMLPICPLHVWPTIVYRWNMRRSTAPIESRANPQRQPQWVDGLWIEAWAFALFKSLGAYDAFTNAFTTVQENKPKILELKMIYDETAASPEKKVTILTETLLMEQAKQSGDQDLIVAASAGLRKAQEELRIKEGYEEV